MLLAGTHTYINKVMTTAYYFFLDCIPSASIQHVYVHAFLHASMFM